MMNISTKRVSATGEGPSPTSTASAGQHAAEVRSVAARTLACTLRLGTVLVAVACVGCASKVVEPAWKGNAAAALDSFTTEYLAGNSVLAASDFAQAHGAMSSTGRIDLVAHAELVRCAVATASIDGGDSLNCAGFAPLAAEATPAERAYANYLAGRWIGLDPALLPQQHQGIVRAGMAGPAGPAKSSLANVADPLSRLVAAGASLQAGKLTADDIGIAIDTASSQGWRRPLLAWLGIAAQRARAAGDRAELARIERRIALASGR